MLIAYRLERRIMDKIGYSKAELRAHVMRWLSEKIETMESYIDFTIEASQDIKKTPKYDSIREESQEEIYQLQKQLAGLYAMRQSMSRVVNSPLDTVQLGALVITNKARFYISISLGEFFFEGDRFYAISLESPIAKKMLGMRVGQDFVLNRIHQHIVEVV